MSYHERHDVVFQNQFRNFPEGHALYLPVPSAAMKPGTCGYFDHNGDWQTIVQLTDSGALEHGGWTAAKGIDVNPNRVRECWGAMASENVFQFDPNLEIGSAIPGTPASAGLKVGYKIKNDCGGILLTDGEVSNDHLTAQASEKAKAWFVENAKAILNQYSDAKKKGIWIVTKTYAANQRAVALLRSKETKVIFGVNAELLTVGKIAPEVSWWKGSKEEVWKVAEAKDKSDGIVLFMSGWYWRPSLFSRHAKPDSRSSKHKMFLGGSVDESLSVETNPGETVELNLENIGDFDIEVGTNRSAGEDEVDDDEDESEDD